MPNSSSRLVTDWGGEETLNKQQKLQKLVASSRELEKFWVQPGEELCREEPGGLNGQQVGHVPAVCHGGQEGQWHSGAH